MKKLFFLLALALVLCACGTTFQSAEEKAAYQAKMAQQIADKLDNRRRIFFRLVYRGEKIKTLIGNGHHAYIRLYRAEGVVCRLRTGIGYGVKECGLSDIRKTYDT